MKSVKCECGKDVPVPVDFEQSIFQFGVCKVLFPAQCGNQVQIIASDRGERRFQNICRYEGKCEYKEHYGAFIVF
jgi:hypothetical protein